jgi:hypothetical protein
MFLYSQYDLHAERFGLRSPGPADHVRLRLGRGLGSPFQLRGRCKAKQQLSSQVVQFRCVAGKWNAAETTRAEDMNLLLRTYSADVKGVLL